MSRLGFRHYPQLDEMDCGPTCLRMIAKHYGRTISLEKLRKLSETTREGSSLRNIADTSEKIGFRSLGVKINFKKLLEEAPLPAIVFWQQHHFVVVYKIKENTVYVADPAHGLLKYSKDEFIKKWIGAEAKEETEEGVVLLLEPTPKLKHTEIDDLESRKGFSFLYQYLFRYKNSCYSWLLVYLRAAFCSLSFHF